MIHIGRLARRLLAAALTLAVIVAVLLTGAVWRLSQGPLELAWLVERIEHVLNEPGSPTRIRVGSAALAWEGFQHGLSSPIDLRLTDVTLTDITPDAPPRITIPRADLLLSMRHLVRMRIAPTAIEIDGPRLTLVRARDGTITVDLGTLTEAADAPPSDRRGPDLIAVLKELSEPIDGDATDLYGHLRIVRVRGAAITIQDHAAGTVWLVPNVELDLTRRPGGGADGTARMTVALGDDRPSLSVTATLLPNDGGARLAATMTPVTPATLAQVSGTLAALGRFDAPISIAADIETDAGLRPRAGTLRISVGAGTLRLTDLPIALEGAEARVSVAGDVFELDALTLTVRPNNAAPTTLLVGGRAVRGAEGYTGSVTVGFDQVGFADLPLLWPSFAAPDARDWILENVTTGTARNAAISVDIAAAADLAAPRVTGVSGGIDADELTVHWLRPVQPLERGRARLNFLSHDALEILVATARQRGGPRGGYLTGSNGRLVITGLSVRDQFMTIDADIAGPVPAAFGLLREPRLGLLDKQKIELKDPSGDASVRLGIHFPLEKSLRVEDVDVKVTAKLAKLRLAGLVAGRDIEQGDIDLEATNTGLTIKGRAQLAGIGVGLDGTMDFRDGPPTQVQRKVSITGRASVKQLVAAGLDPEDWLEGDVNATAVWSERRNGTADIVVDADLTQAALVVPPLVWSKPKGKPARGGGRVQIVRDQMRLIDRVVIDGEGIAFRGAMDCAENRIVAIRIERAAFGRNDLRGTVRLPPGQPVVVNLTGTVDAAAKLLEREPKPEPDAKPQLAWTIDSQFDRAFLAHGKVANSVVVRGRFDGRIYPALMVGGLMSPTQPFRLDITGSALQRRLSVTADDAGALLLGLDLIKTMEGGKLAVTGTFDDRRSDNRLTGTAKITEFRARGSVGLAKLLQAMTLYGLVDVLRGPGIGFSELVAPFHKDDRQIVLNDARAFSPSLGLTAKGAIIPHEDRIDVEGTIVPAYFFNSLLGNIPLVGRLFSPETGGGLFAARYSVRGPLEDPTVFVNPLSALTPGFLREIFGIF